MAITAADIKFLKAKYQTDTTTGGGKQTNTEWVSRTRHGLFSRVTKSERTSGVERYRKFFWAARNDGDDSAYDVMVFLLIPSTAADRFVIAEGTQTNTVGDIDPDEGGTDIAWVGCGYLNANVTAGDNTVDVLMEGPSGGPPEAIFLPGGYFFIHNMIMDSQTIASDVKAGDSVQYSSGDSEWQKISNTSDYTYPNGIALGNSRVLSEQAADTREWIELKENKYTDEDIGDGDGSTTNPALTTLANATNGILGNPVYAPVVTATSSADDSTMTVTVGSDGTCTGDCSAGELNLADGSWTTDIDWTTAPKNSTNILITYYEKNWSISGNVATVELNTQVANDYTAAESVGSGVIYTSEAVAAFSNFTVNSSGGTYDDTTAGNLDLNNKGVEYESYTLTFSSATAFTCTNSAGTTVGTGSVSADFEPVNSETSEILFSIASAGWGGTFTSGDTVTFTTTPCNVPIWMREIVDAGTSAVTSNHFALGYYFE